MVIRRGEREKLGEMEDNQSSLFYVNTEAYMQHIPLGGEANF